MTTDYECPKCKTGYEATEYHEDDAGEQTCVNCGFEFNVDIEYSPHYDTNCIVHEFGEFEYHKTERGDGRFRFCKHCGQCEMKPANEI